MLPGTIPLVPLPNVVLFPDVFLPLHIFEPRYVEMTKAALDDNRLIGMVGGSIQDMQASSALNEWFVSCGPCNP